MKRARRKYNKPKIVTRRIRVNFFWSKSRSRDSSLIDFLGGDFYVQAASHGCFLAGTKISLSSGKSKDIEKITSSEEIVSYEPHSYKISTNKVAQLLVHRNETNEYYVINHSILVTRNHRVWTNNLGWKRVDQLKIGDRLLDTNIQPLIVNSLERKSEKVTVYNLHLNSAPHTFFADGILAHNSFPVTMEKTP